MPAGADVVVVGGGIIGCSAAHELSRRGVRVILFERDELAAGSSGRNHGLLLSPLDGALVPMAEATKEVYDAFVPNAPVRLAFDRDPVGFLVVAGEEESERAAGRLEAEAAAGNGVAVDHLDRAGIHDLEPELADDLVEGWLLHDGRRLQPDLLTAAFALAARAHSADVRTHTAVRGLLEQGGAIRGVITEDGITEAATVVLAAGPWSAPLARGVGIRLPVVGARGWLVSLAPDPAPLARLVERAGWHEPPETVGLAAPRAEEVAGSWPPAVLGTLLQPNPDGTLLVGGSRQASITGEPEDPSVPRSLVDAAIKVVPSVASAGVLSAWWGIRPMTPDGRPVVGGLADGLLVATGHGSTGVILGGGTALLVASMVLGEEAPFDPSPFDPVRFSDGRPLLEPGSTSRPR